MLVVAVGEQAHGAPCRLLGRLLVGEELVDGPAVAQEAHGAAERQGPVERYLVRRALTKRCLRSGDIEERELERREVRQVRRHTGVSPPARLGPGKELSRDVAQVVRSRPHLLDEAREVPVETPAARCVHAGPGPREHP